MMHYKRSIIDVLKDILPSIDADQGRRRTLIKMMLRAMERECRP